jgi:hypothetical protein
MDLADPHCKVSPPSARRSDGPVGGHPECFLTGRPGHLLPNCHPDSGTGARVFGSLGLFKGLPPRTDPGEDDPGSGTGRGRLHAGDMMALLLHL